MRSSRLPGSLRPVLVVALAAGGVLAGCTSDDDTPDEAPVETLSDKDVVDQPPPDGENDVGNGSGEGGNRSDSDLPTTSP